MDPVCMLTVEKKCIWCGQTSLVPCSEAAEVKCTLPVKKTCEQCKRTSTLSCWEKEESTTKCLLPISKTCRDCRRKSIVECWESVSAPCRLNVDVKCKRCKTVSQRLCCDQEEHQCRQIIKEKCLDCGRLNSWECCVPEETRICRRQVRFRRKCGHEATRLCSQLEESDGRCTATVEWVCERCDEKKQLPCCESGEYVCTEEMLVVCPLCYGHSTAECHEADDVQCEKPAEAKCKTCHRAVSCCCYQRLDPPCERKVSFHLPCGHIGERTCGQKPETVECIVPCERLLTCGHPCKQLCNEPCDSAPCQLCEEKRLAEAETRRKQREEEARQEIDNILEMLGQDQTAAGYDGGVLREYLEEDDNEYLAIHDMVHKYTQPQHDWYPLVKHIEKVTNIKLMKRFFAARKELHDILEPSQRKFHGSSKEAIEKIVTEGFRVGKWGMYGGGIYFATDSSKSQRYSKESRQLLVCDVSLGKVHTANEADGGMNKERLQELGCDSLFAPRNTKRPGQNGVRYDEFVVYDPAQVLPRFIVHYDCHELSQKPNLKEAVLAERGIQRIRLNEGKDRIHPSELEMRYSIAEAHFRRLLAEKRRSDLTADLEINIDCIELVVNPTLQENYLRRKAKLDKKRGGKQWRRSEDTFSFFRTDLNVDSIVDGNLMDSADDCGEFGEGFYFTEDPLEVQRLTHGSGSQQLLLCSVLLGDPYECDARTKTTHMRKILRGRDCNSAMYGNGTKCVVFNQDQVLPLYIIHTTQVTMGTEV